MTLRTPAVAWRALAVAALLAGTASAQAIDRSKRPVAPPPPVFTFPAVASHTLPNGLVVRIVENHALPLVAVRMFIEGGSLLDSQGKEGTFALDTLLLRDGTTSKTGEQLAAAIDEMGAPLSATRFTTVSAQFEQSLALMGDMLMNPTFPADAVERRKSAYTASLTRAEGTAATPGLRIFNATIWGPAHPFARIATPTNVAAVTRDELVRFHERYVRPQNVTLTIVGDVTAASVMPVVTKVFGAWQRTGARTSVDVPAPPSPKPTTIHLYDRPGSQQATVFLGQTAPSRSTPDAYALEAMGAMLGAGTGSRLVESLRERRSLTYGVSHRAMWRRANDPSSIHGSANVDAAKVDSAIVLWLDELKALAGDRPPTANDVAFARAATAGALLTRIETIDSVANRLNLIASDALPVTHYDDYVRGMNRVTPAEVGAAAARTIDPARTTIVVVGDRAVVEPVLRGAKIAPVVIVDRNGNPVP